MYYKAKLHAALEFMFFFEGSFPAHEHATKDSKHVGMWMQPAPALGGACAAAAQHACSYLVHQPNCIRAANKINCMAGATMQQRVFFSRYVLYAVVPQ